MQPQSNKKTEPVNKPTIKQSGQEPSRVNLLISKMTNIGLDSIPQVTLLIVVTKILIFQELIKLPWDKWELCISADSILKEKDLKRFILSPFQHADEKHLCYNMISFLIKGRTLENHYGSTNFAILLTFLILLTNAVYIFLAIIGTVMSEESYMNYCTIGFSGVVFAVKVLTTAEAGDGTVNVMGYQVPIKYAAWAELIAVRKTIPNASTLAHLAGILTGCAYIYTPLGLFMDNVISSITGTVPQELPHINTKKPEAQRKIQGQKNKAT